MGIKKEMVGVVLIVVFVLFGSAVISCSKNDPSPTDETITYSAHIKPLIASRCTPCHLPPDGFKTYFDSYPSSKKYIDEMILRIQLPRTDTASMPWKKAKLSEAEIQKFVKWKVDGLLEK